MNHNNGLENDSLGRFISLFFFNKKDKVKPGCEAVDKEIKWCLDNVKALEGVKDFPKVKEGVQVMCDAYVDKAKQCIRR